MMKRDHDSEKQLATSRTTEVDDDESKPEDFARAVGEMRAGCARLIKRYPGFLIAAFGLCLAWTPFVITSNLNTIVEAAENDYISRLLLNLYKSPLFPMFVTVMSMMGYLVVSIAIYFSFRPRTPAQETAKPDNEN